MVIKILNGGSTFHGIDYNEKKVEIGKAERLSLDNFNDFSEYDKSNIKEELNTHSKLKNNRSDFKNKQLHVALSVEGKLKSKEELLKIGRDYLEYMGYGGNPAAFYFHSDTNNNHIHIVTSRVDTNGKRVDSSFERLKGLKFIKEYLGIDYSINQQTKLQELRNLNYSTAGQIISIGKELGFDISSSKDDDDKLKIYYQGQFVQESTLSDFSIKPNLKKEEEKRIKQMRALIYKYQKTIPFKYLGNYLHKQFGIQLVFNKTRNYSFELKGNNIELKNYTGPNNIFPIPKDLKQEVQNLKDVNRLYDLRDRGSKELNHFMKVNISQLDARISGYNILDSSNNNVFKGSDLIKYKKLEEYELQDPFNKKIVEYLSSKDFDHLKEYLDNNNAFFTSDLNISYQDKIIELEKSVRANLVYDKIYHLKEGYSIMDSDLAKQLENILQNTNIDIQEFLKSNQLNVVTNIDGIQVLIDEKDRSIHELNSEYSDNKLIDIIEPLKAVFNLSVALFTWNEGEFENDLNDHLKKKKKNKRLKL